MHNGIPPAAFHPHSTRIPAHARRPPPVRTASTSTTECPPRDLPQVPPSQRGHGGCCRRRSHHFSRVRRQRAGAVLDSADGHPALFRRRCGSSRAEAVIHACISPSQRCKLGPVSSEPVELCSKLKLKHKPACELLVRDLVDSRIEPARANKRMRIASHCLHYLLFQNVRSPSHRWRKSSRRREPQPERPFFIFQFYSHGLEGFFK